MLGVVVLTILFIFFSRYLKKKNSKAHYKAKLPPRLPGAWPFIGHFPVLATSGTPHIELARLADKHGPIFTLDLGKHSVLVVRGLHFELLPFGAGRRECPAKSYGVQMMQFTMASLLQAFDIASVNDEPIDRTTGIGLTNTKVTDLEIIASPRLPWYCFE